MTNSKRTPIAMREAVCITELRGDVPSVTWKSPVTSHCHPKNNLLSSRVGTKYGAPSRKNGVQKGVALISGPRSALPGLSYVWGNASTSILTLDMLVS